MNCFYEGMNVAKKKFEIIYADPPWRYAARKNTSTKFGGGAMAHYNTMSWKELQEFGKLMRPEIADDALLFLWTTGPKMIDAFDFMASMGFKYVTVAFTWVKTNADGTPFAGPGNYTASNSEFVLLGRKGSMLKPAKKLTPSVVLEKRGKHSAKPWEVHTRIGGMYPKAKKIELFAREMATDGWFYHGDELADDKKVFKL